MHGLDRCFVGIHSTLGLFAELGDDARLEDLSLLPDGARAEPGSQWAGSPARPASVPVPEAAPAYYQRKRRWLWGALHLLASYLIALLVLPTVVPGLLILRAGYASQNTAWFLASLPAAALVSFATLALWLPILKRIILPRASRRVPCQ